MGNKETETNPDWERITHLFKLGIIASIFALVGGDMLFGWGTVDETLTGLQQYFSRYLTVSDARIFWAALLGMLGIAIETMCFFGIYRLIDPFSKKYAHLYRAGLIGMLITGPFCHVMCCATAYYHNALCRMGEENAIPETLVFAKMFLLPVTMIFFVFFMIMNTVQILSFAKGKTPYPKWCAVFSILTGVIVIILMKLVGNHAWAYAVSTGWLSIGSLITFTGLLVNMAKAKKEA